MDTGDFIVVVNAAKLRVTGSKAERQDLLPPQRLPGRHLKQTNFAKLQATQPERVLQKAVKGMLPKGPLGYAMLQEAEDLRRRDAPARGAAAEGTGDLEP